MKRGALVICAGVDVECFGVKTRTNSSEMIDNLNRLCELLWKSGDKLESVDVKKYLKNKK